MKNQRRYSGQSLIETAMILPLALILITGFLDVGRAVFYYSSLTNAVREATRFAIVHKADVEAAFNNPADNTLQDKVLEYAFGLTVTTVPLEKDDISVIVEKEDNGIYFSTVSIEAVYPYEPITPGIKQIFGLGNGITLTAQSKMHVTPGCK